MSNKEQYEAGTRSKYKMRSSKVLRTIREGKVARILKCNTSDAKVAEIFAMAKPDALWLCMEHTSLTYEQAEHQVRAAKMHDVDALMRVSRGGYSDYIRPLEIDCAGLIIPQIESLADAIKVRDMTKFAPLGERGNDGGNNDAAFTKVDMLDYLTTSNKERFVCYQIEHPRVIDDLDAIAELEGVDALFFGPGDYSIALGVPGEMQHPEIKRVRELVAKVARKNNKIAATVGSPAIVGDYIGMGYNLLNIGADVVALINYAEETLEAFDKIKY